MKNHLRSQGTAMVYEKNYKIIADFDKEICTGKSDIIECKVLNFFDNFQLLG